MRERLTKNDVEKIQAEIEHRKLVERKELIEAVKEARSHGDLSENFEYHAAKKAKNQNESRIRYLERMLKTAEIVEDHSKEDEIGLNNTVELYCEDDDEVETYRIVTSVRGSSLNGLVSIESPIGKAMLGHKEGERVYIKVNDDFGYYVVIRKVIKTEELEMKITTVLFDLDGTLTDSGPGIMNSVKYALEKVGEPTPDVDELRKFIGPPLKGQFMEHCGIDEEKAAEMVTLYREYFTVTGIFENSVYDGVEEMLKTLKQAGLKIAMATSKPEKFAKIIADHFELAQYFDVIGGACMDETRTEKQDVIRYVLEQCEEKELDKIVMVGDRSYDILGGHAEGLKVIGVLYGYGDLKELSEAGADALATTPQEVAELVLATS